MSATAHLQGRRAFAEQDKGEPPQPPVIDICRATAGSAPRASMRKWCFSGLIRSASFSAAAKVFHQGAFRAQRGAQIHPALPPPKAGIELTGRCHPQAVAAGTEIVVVCGVIRPNLPAGLDHLDIAAPGRRSKRQCLSASSGPSRSRLTSSSGQVTGRAVPPRTSPSGMTSIRVTSCPSPCAHAMRSGNSPSFTPFSADRVQFHLQPRRLGRSNAFQNLWQRIAPGQFGKNFAGSSVSSETFTRRTPAFASASA